MNDRALVSFGTGVYEQLLEISRPGFAEYADRHGYDLHTDPPTLFARPAAWMKIPLLSGLLDSYREVLWIDCDVVIRDPSADLTDEVPDQAWQALVRHRTPDGEVPNTGVWLLRHEMRAYLDDLWGMDDYLLHPWWEQGALCELLGYSGLPLRLTVPSELYWRTHWLGLEWNSHEERDRHPTPRFAHATFGPLGWRLTMMQQRASERPPVAEKGAISG